MVVLTAEDYEKLAEQVSQDYLTHGTPLNDGVYKLASELGLNPAQVKNIAWNANTRTHLALFEKQAEDKVVEFGVCDPEYVLRRLYTPTEEQPLPVKTASYEADFYGGFDRPAEKVAEEKCVEEKPISEATKAFRRGKATRTMRKAASELEHHIYIEREGYMDALHKLSWNLRVNQNRDEFEKDAYALYGESVLPILNDARAVYRLETTSAEKIASAVERLVDTDTEDFELLASARGHYDEAVKYAHALNWLQEKFKDIL